MKKEKTGGRHFKRTFLVTALILGGTTMAFQGVTKVVAASEYNKTSIIQTSYTNLTDVSEQTKIPKGYQEADYTVKTIDLEYYSDKTPTEKDLTKEAAAERMAQYLFQVYNANLEGQTIEMGYDTSRDYMPRPTWMCHIEMKDQDYHDGYLVTSYDATIDSVTGELYNIAMGRNLQEQVKVGADYSMDDSEYKTAVKNYAEKNSVVQSDIVSITCTGQGASFATNTISEYGDPDSCYLIKCSNGEVASITISRYDKVITNITYNGKCKYDLKQIEEWDKKFEEEDAKVGQKAVTSLENDENCELIPMGE